MKPKALLRLGLPKGRMQENVSKLFAQAGIEISGGSRNYRPRIHLDDVEVKLLKPQNIVEMLHNGSRDIGFAGADWVEELDAELIELLDTGFNPVRLVAAAPAALLNDGKLPQKELTIASEYQQLTQRWIARQGLNARFLRTYGATEVFPPEDADCIVDNTSTGDTLRSNQLQIIDELMTSSTRLYATPRVLDVPEKRERIENFVLLLRSVLDARERVMVELNVAGSQLEEMVMLLPCMKKPTISTLYGNQGYAIKVAVVRNQLPHLIPHIRAKGGRDIVVTQMNQFVS